MDLSIPGQPWLQSETLSIKDKTKEDRKQTNKPNFLESQIRVVLFF